MTPNSYCRIGAVIGVPTDIKHSTSAYTTDTLLIPSKSYIWYWQSWHFFQIVVQMLLMWCEYSREYWTVIIVISTLTAQFVSTVVVLLITSDNNTHVIMQHMTILPEAEVETEELTWAVQALVVPGTIGWNIGTVGLPTQHSVAIKVLFISISTMFYIL